jgi:hypothetical protein
MTNPMETTAQEILRVLAAASIPEARTAYVNVLLGGSDADNNRCGDAIRMLITYGCLSEPESMDHDGRYRMSWGASGPVVLIPPKEDVS